MMKSLVSSVLRMTSLGPMFSSSSFGLRDRRSSRRTQRSTRRRARGASGWLQGEIGDEELALTVGGPSAGRPHQPLAVRAEHRQAVEPLVVRDPLLLAGVDVHQVELVIR